MIRRCGGIRLWNQAAPWLRLPFAAAEPPGP